MTQSTIIAILASLVLTGCDYPWWKLDSIKVEAHFQNDGSCSFSVDGHLATNGHFRQQDVNAGGCAGCTSGQLDGYFISCHETTSIDSPSLVIFLVLRKGAMPQPGRFGLTEGIGRLESVGTTMEVLGLKKYSTTSYMKIITNGILGANLVAVDGALVIERVTEMKLAESLTTGGLSVVGYVTADTQRRASGF